ncbi:uncharacterized protein LOC128326888 [Hemicordylus capensis]|uniref:uncharacterized protein LOC128326888 n=1 Tax=Hemicordylus capensis TaxID=884348 RepID=UPI002302C557|nr:uncharacterized protein LOC128326888 [Hemicordylus capensis]XP_053110702.1 uncharacterized protein LOC128326888 [Hemicordylus capensis]XP_053110703.1 uncharacterized protein LOC128326888 [Hemicordylus capensis]XP_053110706.1 uncharacterized protein LOC128326888 [Hemicordylus capensis]XP_053110707.1 uncharacterized protein LOC128326888 [Hemicordylus capensis]XP_053110708.1 uncharacterized protein LOC128326888 [Hemicordylus capensis]XP_053110709.1 uncharacterized protein LOC128326888 [Hemico
MAEGRKERKRKVLPAAGRSLMPCVGLWGQKAAFVEVTRPICARETEALRTRLQHTLKQGMSGIGGGLEGRWKCGGLEGLKTRPWPCSSWDFGHQRTRKGCRSHKPAFLADADSSVMYGDIAKEHSWKCPTQMPSPVAGRFKSLIAPQDCIPLTVGGRQRILQNTHHCGYFVMVQWVRQLARPNIDRAGGGRHAGNVWEMLPFLREESGGGPAEAASILLLNPAEDKTATTS